MLAVASVAARRAPHDERRPEEGGRSGGVARRMRRGRFLFSRACIVSANPGPTRPILLLGAAGQLGGALAPRLASLGEVVRCARADVDLERTDEIRALVRRVKPRVVVNTAAYTAVDGAEADQARCARLNVMAPTVLAEETARLGVPLVDFSTNYVFDGLRDIAYDESVPPSPVSVYGVAKEAGERAIASANPRHLVLRTAALYSPDGRNNFVRRILELARQRDELRVVDDQFVSPTPAWVLADATVVAIGQMLERGEPAYGVFHLTTRGAVSWFEFARRILALDPDRKTQRVRNLVAIGTADYATPARRPPNGVLDTARFERVFDVSLPEWDDAMHRTFQGVGTVV